jgi:fructose-1,6-bisphosphatase/inositol monophosphatase family enzyme
MLPDVEAVARIIAEIAAAEIMPRFACLASHEVREKGPGDLVTVADVAAEHALTPRLRDLLPGSLVVGEEAVAAEAAVLDRLEGDDPVWLVDPIDGTFNFAGGRPLFAVMVALVRRGETLIGWIHDPVAGATATAAPGAGAWRDGTRLKVAPPPRPDADGNRAWRANRRLSRRLAAHPQHRGTSFDMRCAGHEYLALAGGDADVALYNRLHPWDHAAGALLHREAGGFGALLDGTPYAPRVRGTGLLLTPDAASWQLLHGLLIAPA